MSYTDARLYHAYEKMPVAVQDVLVSVLGLKRRLAESSPRFRTALRELVREEFLPEEDLLSIRAVRLRHILRTAARTVFYAPLLAGTDVDREDPFAILRSLPLLEKSVVRDHPGDFIPARNPRRLVKHGTSGTTGTPLQVFWTDESIRMERALVWRHRMRHGCVPGRSWRGVLVGHRIVPLGRNAPPFWRVNLPERQIHLSTYHISPSSAPFYGRELLHRGVEFLEGYPSVLHALAWSLEQAGMVVPMRGVFFGAEPLLPFQREVIERVFGCRAWDFYGLTERVVSASQFECGTWLHLNWENCIPEIVDGTGGILPDGETGELVGTSLSNLGFVLIRYRTGDMTRTIPGTCPCGRCSPRMAPVDTKREDLLLMPDGSLLSASSLTYPFKEAAHLRESQILQEEPGRLIIRLVPAPGYGDEDGRTLLQRLGRCLPGGVELSIELLETIERSAAGKYSFCVSLPARKSGVCPGSESETGAP